MGIQMAVGSMAMMTAPLLGGFAGQIIGMWVLPVIMLAAALIMGAAALYLSKYSPAGSGHRSGQ